MGTDPDKNNDLRFNRSVDAGNVRRLLWLFRVRVFNLVIQFLDAFQHLFGAPDDPDRFTAPCYGNLLTWFNLADIDGYRCACCFRFGTGIPGRHERNCCTDDADSTDHGRCADQKPTSALAYVAIIHYGSLPSGDVTARQAAGNAHLIKTS